MGLFKGLFGKRATKVSGYSATDPNAYRLFGPQPISGVVITPETAQNLSAVWCALTNISTGVAKLPIHTYRRNEKGGKERDYKHPVYKLLHVRPNRWMSAFELKEMIAGHLLLRGNFFAQVVYANNGVPMEMIPLHPDLTTVTVKGDRFSYEYQDPQNGRMLLNDESVLHIRGLGSNGVVGKSVIAVARDGLARMTAMNSFAGEFFSNGSAPLGVLQYPQILSKEAKTRLQEDWEEMHKGEGKRHRAAVLEQGLTWQSIGISGADSQLLESRMFEIEEVARWFNIPPHKLKHLLRSTFSNIEHQNQEYYEDTILPWTMRIQNAINAFFFFDDAQKFTEFSYDSLLITDTKTRYEAHNLALLGGWKTRNEVRVIENLNQEDGLDEFMTQLNMGPVNGADGTQDAEPANDTPKPADERQASCIVHLRYIIQHELDRSARREAKSNNEDKLKQDFVRDISPIVISCLEFLRGGVTPTAHEVAGTIEEFWGAWREHAADYETPESRIEAETDDFLRVMLKHRVIIEDK